MMYSAIKDFARQFEFKPLIVNQERLKRHKRYVVVGMGGSALAADVLTSWDDSLEIVIHKDYGLPNLPENILKQCLVICNSYSGNTEETLEALKDGIARGLDSAVITVNGQLLNLAAKHKLPYVRLPDTGIQPRSALGFSVLALVKLMALQKAERELKQLPSRLNSADLQSKGKQLAKKLKSSIPIIYSSRRNFAIGYNWKIKFNETGKVPAFYNVLPELNHNEMTGFDVIASTRKLSRDFGFLFLTDREDQPKINKRFEVLARLYADRGLQVSQLPLSGKSRFERIFNSLLLADWVSFYTAEGYGAEAEKVPMVEEFKQLIR